MTEPTNLHALLGDRHDAVIEKAARTLFALEEPDRNDWRWNRTNPDDPLGPVAWHSYWLGAAESALGAVLPGLLAEVEAERDALAEEVADMLPRDWHGLMTILADVYPETVFPTLPDYETRDAVPRIVSLMRRVDALAAKVERVRGMAEAWATQPTDYDEDTEQQIEDGKAIVRALDGGDPA